MSLNKIIAYLIPKALKFGFLKIWKPNVREVIILEVHVMNR